MSKFNCDYKINKSHLTWDLCTHIKSNKKYLSIIKIIANSLEHTNNHKIKKKTHQMIHLIAIFFSLIYRIADIVISLKQQLITSSSETIVTEKY